MAVRRRGRHRRDLPRDLDYEMDFAIGPARPHDAEYMAKLEQVWRDYGRDLRAAAAETEYGWAIARWGRR